MAVLAMSDLSPLGEVCCPNLGRYVDGVQRPDLQASAVAVASCCWHCRCLAQVQHGIVAGKAEGASHQADGHSVIIPY